MEKLPSMPLEGVPEREERTSGLKKALPERAEKEPEDITTVLTELQHPIEK